MNPMPDNDQPQPTASAAHSRRLPAIIAAAFIACAAGFGGIYGIDGLMRNASGPAECKAAVDLAAKISPFAKGEVAALTMASAPLKLPDLAFEDTDGKPRKLSDWKGRTVLVNLWATWCVPCRREMPALN